MLPSFAQDSWEIDITSSGYAYAAVVNLAILHANKEATVALWNEALIVSLALSSIRRHTQTQTAWMSWVIR